MEGREFQKHIVKELEELVKNNHPDKIKFNKHQRHVEQIKKHKIWEKIRAENYNKELEEKRKKLKEKIINFLRRYMTWRNH